MAKITILKETAPTRCEVCHQTDLYNPTTNYCSRCSSVTPTFNNEKNVNQQLAFPQINYQLIQPDAVELIDSGSTYSITYRWRSLNNIKRNLVIMMWPLFGLMNMISNITSNIHYLFHPFNLIFISTIVITYLLSFMAVFMNKTNIVISGTKLLTTSGPIALFAKKEIALADITDVFYKRRHNTDMLCVKLKDGSTKRLINHIDDRESILFIEKTLKEKIKHLH